MRNILCLFNETSAVLTWTLEQKSIFCNSKEFAQVIKANIPGKSQRASETFRCDFISPPT